MSKVAVVYWSGSGNTEAMADKVAEGAKAAGAEVEVISADDFAGTDIDNEQTTVSRKGTGTRIRIQNISTGARERR